MEDYVDKLCILLFITIETFNLTNFFWRYDWFGLGFLMPEFGIFTEKTTIFSWSFMLFFFSLWTIKSMFFDEFGIVVQNRQRIPKSNCYVISMKARKSAPIEIDNQWKHCLYYI